MEPANILVIDDEQAILKLISRVLNKVDCLVETAGNGHAGLDKFNSSTFDLMIIDMLLGDKNGNDIARYIRSKKSHVPIIAMSGTPWLIEKNSYDAVIQKPFSIMDLIDTVVSFTYEHREGSC